jgi:hypothetical protein
MVIKIIITCFLMLSILSCKRNLNEFDAEFWGKKYCTCFEKYKKIYDSYDARVICNSKMALENRFFKFYEGEILFGNRLKKLPKSTADSVLIFSRRFDEFYNNCVDPKDSTINFDLMRN